MLTRIKKSAGTGGGGTWTEFTETKGSGTGQGRNVTFTIGLKVKSGYGNVKKPPNIAAKYDAIINYADSSVYQIPSANFWTTETTAQAEFSFVNPYPSKTVTSITVKWYSYSSTATTCTLTYLGGTQPVISSITGNPIELTLANAQRAKHVTATYTPIQNGTPSPDNPVAITGRSSDDFAVSNSNLLPPDPRTKTANGITWVIGSDGIVTGNGTATGGTYIEFNVPSWLYGDLVFAGSVTPSGSSSTWNCYMRDNTTNTRVKKWDGTSNSNYLSTSGAYQVQLIKGHTNVVRCTVQSGQTLDNATFKFMLHPKEDTSTDFVEYEGNHHTVNFSETVYGGTYYAGGAFSEEWVNIPSYAGETISEPWLSSLDEYTPGGTPTTGAQVVYPANHVVKTVAADSLPLDLYQGTNNIFANEADDITLSYEE